jgi:hypothetical protein
MISFSSSALFTTYFNKPTASGPRLKRRRAANAPKKVGHEGYVHAELFDTTVWRASLISLSGTRLFDLETTAA